MRKLAAFLICLVVTLCFAACERDALPGASSNVPTEPTHIHEWKDATCISPKTCTTCGETEGEPVDHQWKDATCVAPKTCATCGETEGELVDHQWKDATCVAPETCVTCGETKGEPTEHMWAEATCTTPTICTACGTENGVALGHVWDAGVVIREATDDTDGEILYTCSSCSTTEVRIIPSLSHVHNYSFAVVTPPTCTTGGYTTHSCGCGDSYVDSETDAMGHDWNGGTCAVCGAEESAPYYTPELTFEIGKDLASYCVTGISGIPQSTDIVIPATYQGYPVTAIAAKAFKNTGITSIQIPNSVTRIGMEAFNNCGNLKHVSIPEELGYIDVSVFSGCTSLTSITIPDGVTSIGAGAFYDCYNLESIVIPASVTSVGFEAFGPAPNFRIINVYITDIEAWCTIDFEDQLANPLSRPYSFLYLNGELVTDLAVPEGVTRIGTWAFSSCYSLNSVTIPSSVTDIGAGAFHNCVNLTTVTISEGTTSIGSYAFDSCSLLKSISIPDSIITIDCAFVECFSLEYNTYDNAKYLGNSKNPYTVLIEANNKNITTCIIHEDTKVIHMGAFAECTALTSITIPDSVVGIGDEAFCGCDSLTSVTISNGVKSIGIWAFANCDALTSVTIPDSVTYIGKNAFLECPNLVYRVYDNAKYLGNSKNPYVVLVQANNSKITSCTVHKDTKVIYTDAFWKCAKLTSINISDSVVYIGSTFWGCTSLNAVHITNLTSWLGVDFESYDTNPLYYAHNLYLNGELVTELAIPNGVTSIKSCTFAGCTSLTSITIPDSVTSIGKDAFIFCSGLTGVTIPDSVISIGTSAFSYCDGLTSVTVPDSVTSIGFCTFSFCNNLTGIWVDPNNRYYSSDDRGVLFNKDQTIVMAGPGALSGSYIIPNSVTEIEGRAFEGCALLTSVTIPSRVGSVGYFAFESCSSLERVQFDGTVEQWDTVSIGSYMLRNTLTTEVICIDGKVEIDPE